MSESDSERDQSEKTEEPSERKRRQAEERGDIASTREIPQLLALFALLGLFSLMGPQLFRPVLVVFEKLVREAAITEITPAKIISYGMEAGIGVLPAVGPILLAMMAFAVCGHLLQRGFRFYPEAIQLHWNRLSVVQGIKKLFGSIDSLSLILKSIIKLGAIGYIGYRSIRAKFLEFPGLINISRNDGITHVMLLLLSILLKVTILMAIVAAADYLFEFWKKERKLKMTREERKQESKDQEGDPQVRSRRRSLARELAFGQMMSNVPTADVIINNPRHLSIAIRYSAEDMKAPQVLAKGAGYVALKIRQLARSNQIPQVENKPLARALFRSVRVGQQIPPELYHAMAEVLAFVYRVKHRTAIFAQRAAEGS